MNEYWVSLPNYSRYEVSSLGRVKSLSRVKRWSHHGKSGKFLSKGLVLKQIKTRTGYPQVTLKSDSNTYRIFHIHRLVALAFIPNPQNKPQVNHKNGVKNDNRVENLEWVTVSENTKHGYDVLGVIPSQRNKYGEENNSAKPVLQIDKNGNVIKRWGAAMDAVRAGFDSSCISRCCSGHSFIHKGFKWQYAKD